MADGRRDLRARGRRGPARGRSPRRLKRIGINEISHRTGHRYLTIVVDHDTGRLVWAAPGRDRKTVEAFVDELGPDRCEEITMVSCDMAAWISDPDR